MPPGELAQAPVNTIMPFLNTLSSSLCAADRNLQSAFMAYSLAKARATQLMIGVIILNIIGVIYFTARCWPTHLNCSNKRLSSSRSSN